MNVKRNNKSMKIDYIIPEFVHRPGVHCQSSALRDAFEFHGFNLSEAMIFGLGCGMGLGYIKPWGSEPFFGGGSKDFVQNLCLSTGVSLNVFKTKKAEEGWQRLKDRLERNLPSAIYIDIGFLSYQDLPGEDYHFGYHLVTVCGYNAQKETVLVADTNLPDIKEITVKELTEGRNSKYDKFMPPQNSIFELTFPKKLSELETIITSVLHKIAKGLVSSSGRLLKLIGVHGGVKSIDVFLKDIDKWEKLSDSELKKRCENQAGYISSYGTGGGLFRYIFSDFLKESSEMLNDDTLQSLSAFYRNLGDNWEELSKLFIELSKISHERDKRSVITKIEDKLSIIKDLEMKGANQLQNFGI